VGILVDTSVLIEHERHRLTIEPHVLARGDEEVFLSVVTASELLHGVHRAHDPAVRARRAAWIEGVLGSFPLLPIDFVTARAHARLWAGLAAEGRMIGPNDLWLAATAVARGLTLVTANGREFSRVPGLDVHVW